VRQVGYFQEFIFKNLRGQGLFKISKCIFQIQLKILQYPSLYKSFIDRLLIFSILQGINVMHMRSLLFVSYYTSNVEVYITVTHIQNVINERLSRTEHCVVV